MKYKLRQLVTNIMIIAIIIALSLVVFYVESEVTVSITIFISAIAAFGVFIQLNRTKELATGEFILSLHQEFSSENGGVSLFTKCWLDLESTEDEQCKLIENKEEFYEETLKYLTFFESLYTMVDKDILGIEILDDLFGRRFFLVVNSISIQKFDLVENYKYYLNIYKLHAIWKHYRKKQGKGVELFDHTYEKANGKLRDLEEALEQRDSQLWRGIYKKESSTYMRFLW